MLIDDLSFTLPRNGIVGSHRPQRCRARPRCSRCSSARRSPTPASIKVGETVKISYVDQSRGGIDPGKSLWEVVSDGLDWIKVGNVEMPSRAYVSAFGFKGPDQQKRAGVLSGGERNRLNLALTLKQGGNLLLLDEPTNDLDVETLSSLENALLEFPGCAVVVSHDRWFLDRVATHILAYEGDSQWFWFEGNFESYEKNKVERLGPEAARPHRATYRKLTAAEEKAVARFTAKVAMRWQDMDAYGHVNNVQFLTYVEEARVEMFQSVPLSGLHKVGVGDPRGGQRHPLPAPALPPLRAGAHRRLGDQGRRRDLLPGLRGLRRRRHGLRHGGFDDGAVRLHLGPSSPPHRRRRRSGSAATSRTTLDPA